MRPVMRKTVFRITKPGLTQPGLYSHSGWLDVCNFRHRNCTIHVDLSSKNKLPELPKCFIDRSVLKVNGYSNF